MPLYEIYSSNITIQYKNTICSKAMFFVVISTFIAIVSPLIISYRSRGFWLKHFIFYEQPDVRFKYQYLFIAETDDLDYVFTCGNIPGSTELFTLFEECFYFKIQEVDLTFDKKTDEIHFTIHLNNPDLKNIMSVKLLMILDYRLHGLCPLQMESLIVYDRVFGLPTSKHILSANLELTQTKSLPCWYNYKDLEYNHSVIQYNTINEENWIEDVLYAYSRRNVSTTLTNKYTSTMHGTAPIFKFDISVAIPEHPVRYKPGVWQELKYAWQQYISLGIIFYWLLIKIKGYVFTNYILPTWEINPWKKYF